MRSKDRVVTVDAGLKSAEFQFHANDLLIKTSPQS